jgi:hypothetical protein
MLDEKIQDAVILKLIKISQKELDDLKRNLEIK